MKFAVFTHVQHYTENGDIFAYAPYVKEIDIWGKFVKELVIVGTVKKYKTETDNSLGHSKIRFQKLESICFTSLKDILKSVLRMPSIIYKIYSEMKKADHIHLRCPGNIGLLAAIVQIFFPRKRKTVKYAGNWDPSSKQPLSYRFQKWLLTNEYLTRNAYVLVYGNWNSNSKNVIPFFTASYSESEKEFFSREFQRPFKFVFVGSLSEGKRPLLAIKIIEKLLEKNHDVTLDIYGEGTMFSLINSSIKERKLIDRVILHGGQNSEIIKKAYQSADFSILPSKSEGWPKALAEAMFYGCVPVSTGVSCIPWMLNYEERGILIEPDVATASQKIETILLDPKRIKIMSALAQIWAQNYTLEKFEKEIRNFL